MMLGMAKRKQAPKPKPPATWPERLKALRAKLGLTQTDMAEKLAISQGQYSKLESGEREPSGPLALLIAHLETA